MSYIRLKTLIAAPLEVCFDVARDINVHIAASKDTGERAVAGVTSGKIGLGETVTWEATHFFVRQKLTSKITVFDRPTLFVDEMKRGPFHHWRHAHKFSRRGNCTLMVDDVDFASPFGVIGSAIDALILKEYMKGLLLKHNVFIKQSAEGLVASA